VIWNNACSNITKAIVSIRRNADHGESKPRLLLNPREKPARLKHILKVAQVASSLGVIFDLRFEAFPNPLKSFNPRNRFFSVAILLCVLEALRPLWEELL
jgi:hypothetical protein